MNEKETLFSDDLKLTIARNLSKYRKAANLTQLELAEKLLYSDKNISKWERGEAIPDVTILKQIADIFGITVNDFLSESSHISANNFLKPKKAEKKRFFSKEQSLIVFLSISLVWLVAVVTYSFFIGFMPTSHTWAWKFFIIALAISGIVATVFSSIWCTNLMNGINVSYLIWMVALAVFICIPFESNWLIFIIAIPLQIITIFWFIFKKINKNIKKMQEKSNKEVDFNENE